MLTKMLAAFALSGALWVSGDATCKSIGCCFPGSECCYPGSECCESTSPVKTTGCCTPKSECCQTQESCCDER